jgi:hypothetical protein
MKAVATSGNLVVRLIMPTSPMVVSMASVSTVHCPCEFFLQRREIIFCALGIFFRLAKRSKRNFNISSCQPFYDCWRLIGVAAGYRTRLAVENSNTVFAKVPVLACRARTKGRQTVTVFDESNLVSLGSGPFNTKNEFFHDSYLPLQ